MARTGLPSFPKLPGLTPTKTRLPDLDLPSGSVRGKRGSVVKEVPQWPTEVPTWMRRLYPRMTLPEALFYLAAQKLGWKHGEDFIYQSPQLETGPYNRSAGSTIVDFFCPAEGRAGSPSIAIQVNGVFYHYTGPWADILTDIDIAQRLVALYGYDVVIVDDEDLLLNPLFYTEQALVYRRDYSRLKGRI